MSLFNMNDSFFEPVWLRAGIVLVTAGWAVFEYVSGSPTWAVIFAAIAVYAFWSFFVTFKPTPRTPPDAE